MSCMCFTLSALMIKGSGKVAEKLPLMHLVLEINESTWEDEEGDE